MEKGLLHKRNSPFDFSMKLVRLTGLEPARRRHQILSLARLPIPPQPLFRYKKMVIHPGLEPGTP